MGSTSSLADLPRQTIADWHRFVATGDHTLLSTLLAEDVVFRSPAVHGPIPGRPATLLVLTTVVRIFENFRYEREFASGSHDAGLEFAANVGKFELKGIDLIKFDADGKMVDFEVMIRPLKALQAVAEAMGSQIGSQLMALKSAAAAR